MEAGGRRKQAGEEERKAGNGGGGGGKTTLNQTQLSLTVKVTAHCRNDLWAAVLGDAASEEVPLCDPLGSKCRWLPGYLGAHECHLTLHGLLTSAKPLILEPRL